MDLHARRLAMLEKRIAGDALMSQILARMLDGLETPAALATATGRTVDEIVVVRRRVLRHAADVAHELGDEAAGDQRNDEDAEDEEEVAS